MTREEVALKVTQELRRGEGPTKLLNIVLEGVGPGWARTSMFLSDAMLNGHGNAHGGMLFLLADTTFAYACNSHNVMTVAQAASITFLAPGVAGETIIAEASETALAGRSGVYDVRLTGTDGRAIAIFQGISRSLGRPAISEPEGTTHDD